MKPVLSDFPCDVCGCPASKLVSRGPSAVPLPACWSHDFHDAVLVEPTPEVLALLAAEAVLRS